MSGSQMFSEYESPRARVDMQSLEGLPSGNCLWLTSQLQPMMVVGTEPHFEKHWNKPLFLSLSPGQEEMVNCLGSRGL